VGHLNANLPKERGTNCLLAAQLRGSTRPGAVAWPGGRAALCLLVGVCQGAGHVMAPGRVSRYAVGRTGQSTGSLRPHCHTSARRKNSRAASSPRNVNRARACRRHFGSSCVQLTPFARPPVACASTYGTHACVPPVRRLRCAAGTVNAAKNQAFGVSILPGCKMLLPPLRQRRSAACL